MEHNQRRKDNSNYDKIQGAEIAKRGNVHWVRPAARKFGILESTI